MYCTLTGADDTTHIDKLLALSAQFPVVEWGILYSQSQRGQGRFPSFQWIEKFAQEIRTYPTARMALHVCGRAVRDYIAGVGHDYEIAERFPRVQLNLQARDHDIDSLRARLQQRPDQIVITQHNMSNANLWRDLGDHSNHALLFDDSGGRGKLRQSWPTPLGKVWCGYAGGLGPDNLVSELPRIHAAAGDAAYWVDMEGQLRDEEDRFDLDRAHACINIVSHFFRQHSAGSRADILKPLPRGVADAPKLYGNEASEEGDHGKD